MKKYIEEKILDSLLDVAEDLNYAAEDVRRAHMRAEMEYRGLSNPENDFLGAVDWGIDQSIAWAKYFHKDLAKFDKHLAKLIALRLRLAEEADLPLNLTGGKVWARNEEYTL